MKLITRVALSIKGDRIEPGTEVELTQSELGRYDKGDFIFPEEVTVAPEPVVVEVPLAEMSHSELKEKAAALGLKATGSKADLIERISLSA